MQLAVHLGSRRINARNGLCLSSGTWLDNGCLDEID